MPNTNQTLGGGGFHHVAIRVRDFEASVRFYTQAMGFVEKTRWGDGDKRGVMLDTGDGNYLEIFAGATGVTSATGPAPEGPIIHFAIRTTDTDAACARARAAGAEVTIEPKDVLIPGKPLNVPVRLAFFKGPDGEVVELFQNDVT